MANYQRVRKILISGLVGASLLAGGPAALAVVGSAPSTAPVPAAAGSATTAAASEGAAAAAPPAAAAPSTTATRRRAGGPGSRDSGQTDGRTPPPAAGAAVEGGAAEAGPAAAATSAAVTGAKPTIALIDTGVRPTHQEFSYGGPNSATDQFVAWWDFTSEVKGAMRLPEAGQVWDDEVADPYDENGHGTWTASMAAGRNASPAKDPSAAPGFPLAIAKVGTGDGTIEGDIAAAIRWAAFTADADVINISLGSIVPLPAFLDAASYEALAEAREAGKLVVVSNGNGFANAGVPLDPGWASSFGGSTDVLAVGADGLDSFLVSTDPEVVAKFADLVMADVASDTGYSQASGTSFSSPFVAGVAARLLDEARTAGQGVDGDYIEKLIKYSAADRPEVPPNFEGYGVVSLATLDKAIAHARAATLPVRPTPDLSGSYTELVAGTLRDLWTNKLRGDFGAVAALPLGLGGS